LTGEDLFWLRLQRRSASSLTDTAVSLNVPPPSSCPRKRETSIDLKLLEAFELRRDSERVSIPRSAERLVAFLALHDHAVLRVHVGRTFWPEVPQERASANLRSTLWRLRQPRFPLVEATVRELRLASCVRVDFRDGVSFAHRLLSAPSDPTNLGVGWRSFAGELLPGCYEEWVLLERRSFTRHRGTVRAVVGAETALHRVAYNETCMTRGCNEEEPRPARGGKAAERLREFLAARFGDKAPAIPPDEEQPGEGVSADAADERAGAPPTSPP
jgi:hypothetical protein